jgi:CRP-like cAMP-binding protein
MVLILSFYYEEIVSNKKIVQTNCESCPSRGRGIFCELERATLDEISRQKVMRPFKKGETLFVQGTPPGGLYCISEGNVKIAKIGANGKESIIRLATSGDILGHRSIFTSQYYNATATALEYTKACFIEKKYILKLAKSEPTVACNLIGRLGKDLGLSENRMASLSQRSVLERLAELLLLLKGSHGKDLGGNRFCLELVLTREEMASMVGTATETIIRFISDLKNEGIISQDGKKIIIENEEKLVELGKFFY